MDDLKSFSDLHQTITTTGEMSNLMYDVKDVGGVIFFLLFRIAIWACLNAVAMVGFNMLMKSGNIRGREEVKAKATRVFLVIIFLLNVSSVAGCALQIGFDMF